MLGNQHTTSESCSNGSLTLCNVNMASLSSHTYCLYKGKWQKVYLVENTFTGISSNRPCSRTVFVCQQRSLQRCWHTKTVVTMCKNPLSAISPCIGGMGCSHGSFPFSSSKTSTQMTVNCLLAATIHLTLGFHSPVAITVTFVCTF